MALSREVVSDSAGTGRATTRRGVRRGRGIAGADGSSLRPVGVRSSGCVSQGTSVVCTGALQVIESVVFIESVVSTGGLRIMVAGDVPGGACQPWCPREGSRRQVRFGPAARPVAASLLRTSLCSVSRDWTRGCPGACARER